MARRIKLKGIKDTYDFEVVPWDEIETLPDRGGVYAVLGRRLEKDVIYIGETGDLSDRPANHDSDKKSCFTRKGKAYVGFCRQNIPDRRKRIEKDLIDGYSPPCNKQ